MIALAVLALSPALSQAPERAFPAGLLGKDVERVELRLDGEAVARLRESRRLVLTDVPWTTPLDLELRRRANPVSRDALHVDGRAVRRRSALGASFWSGSVAGEPGSDVFLAFAGGGVWGWIQRPGELVHVLSGPAKERGDPARTVLVSERALHGLGWRFAPVCEAETGPTSVPRVLGGPILEHRRATLAVESDYQFLQLFGSLPLAEGYVTALLAAANTRFQGQLGLTLKTSYVGFWTTPADPWHAQDVPGTICLDLLYEFQAAWMNGGGPAPSDLHLFLSGVDLGCGAAFINALCDAERGFSVMSRMDGRTPFPVGPGPLNWDFVWTCHELGHNLGSVHTHEYCPPLDECSPAGFFGSCQDEQLCTTTGTMMSYCHACPGGMANFTTWFHPVAAEVMRLAVRASCLPVAGR